MSLFDYPQSDIHRLIEKFIPFLECFTRQEIKILPVVERLAARSAFQSETGVDPHSTTLLLDATPILIDLDKEEPKAGETGVWHEKSKHRGKLLLKLTNTS